MICPQIRSPLTGRLMGEIGGECVSKRSEA
jgi:hypothetical protein